MSHSNDEKLYATKFMSLKPEKMGFFELFQILFGRDLEDKDYVQFIEYTVEPRFGERWYIFLSLLAQKLLYLTANVIKCVGDIVKSCLNAEASHNYNVFMLVFDCIQGKQVVNKESAYYMSMTGHLDKRLELLDSRIKREDPNKYNAALSVMASKLSYENNAFVHSTVVDRWKMMLVDCNRGYWNDYQEKTTTHGFIMLDKSEDDDTYVVAFTGTELFDVDAWCINLDVSWLELPNVGRIHSGYMKALGLVIDLNNNVVGWPKEIENDENRPRAYYSIRDLLKKRLKSNGNDNAKFILTGHSLGGALAILFPAILMLHEEKFLLERLEAVYTFGQPRVGDRTFANYMAKNLSNCGIQYFRFVYGDDIIPRFPFEDNVMKFEHFGTCLYYDRSYKGKKMQDAPNKNYFSWKYMISMRVNAFWELVRSFTIVSKYGPEYQEGWLLRFMRLVGMVFPGIAAHSIQDYVNITRLAFPSHLD